MRVLVAGAGPAGVEAALTLQRIGGTRFATTIVTPEDGFVHLPPTVLSPFAVAARPRPRLQARGAQVRRGRVVAVDAEAREVQLEDGATLPYDALLIAVGGVAHSPYTRALAFGLSGSEEHMHGLVQDLEDGYVRRIAFVVPPGASWPLPVYELALMTAERAFDMCAKAELTLVTPEPSPLALFGAQATVDVAELLAEAGIAVRTGAEAEMPRGNALELRATGERIDVDRVVTVPILSGPAIDGLPHDAAGFLPVDSHGRVNGVSAVYAAGDATDFEIKQGGLACQQADAAAEAIAADSGLSIEPTPFVPLLRGALVTEHHIRWLQRDLDDVELPPRTKFFGRELSRLLDDGPVGAR
jgi:sulfide:quinone oxidoreductase